ncbi:DEAD/DEAH box helicase [Spirochaetia bacterium]|nr:DEAD/DEAH box helicase [Spirochaetia bacterium]
MPETSAFNEANYENAVVSLLESIGYTHLYGPDIERDYHNPLYLGAGTLIEDQIRRINPKAHTDAIEEAVKKLTLFQLGTLIQKNKTFMDYLQNGVEATYQDKGQTKTDIIRLIDYDNPDNNTFHVINQWTVIENENKRPDIVVFVNGLPLVVVELKSCMREETDISHGYRQLKNYMRLIPSLFVYNTFCIISDLSHSRVGTITSDFDRYVDWKTINGDYEETKYALYHVLFEGMLEPNRFLDIIKHFILFSQDTPEDIKILAGYHQYFAVKKAVESTLRASGYTAGGRMTAHSITSSSARSEGTHSQIPKRHSNIKSGFPVDGLMAAESMPEYGKEKPGYSAELEKRGSPPDGKGGVFWHTQGSGKSLSMVFYTGLMQETMNSPTFIVLTDRNNLDDQLFEQFSACKDFLRQTPEQATDRKNLHDILNNRQANGIFFTTMQKFEESGEPLSKRRNIIVMADEAHRSQYGLTEKVNKDGKIVIGTARIIRDSLPNATFIGFTGTPISTKDHNTREVFGDYIDIYDMTQSVEDGATKPVYYESRVINLGLNEDILRKIDETYELMAANADEKDIARSKKELGSMEAILNAPQTIESLCKDIISHYEDNRENLLTGKALLVCYSRSIAINVYQKILELRPAWTEKVKVVMTAGNDDPEEWGKIIGNKTYKKDLAKKFKDNDDPMKIAIVVDMWLTGFDVPSLATMYVYKPMSGHNLMQAIARVNRVFKDKEGGLVVDYIGIAAALKAAMNDFTKRDRANYGDTDIAKTALPKFIEKLQVCGELFHGFDYSPFMNTSDDGQRARTITGGINFILGKDEETQKQFRKEALLLKQAKTLCQSLLDKSQRYESAYFETVRVATGRITEHGKLSFTEINNQINELLRQSIKSEGVINLFDGAKEDFSLFDPKFLEEIARMKEKNLAAELLRKLISEQVRVFNRTDTVQAEKFSERMKKLMNAYRNGLLSNADVIDELKKMAADIASAHKEGDDLGLTSEELAFYHAITKPDAVKDFYSNDQLREMTRELTDMLRNSRTIDWQIKKSARAGMRMAVKKLLKKYKYPPEGMEDAIQTVISQCELWTDDAALP